MIEEHQTRASCKSNEALHMKQDTTSIEFIVYSIEDGAWNTENILIANIAL